MNQSNFIIELNKLGIYPTKIQLDQLNKYYELLVEYNKIMNLTSIIDKESVYLKHFYDSLTIAKIIDLNNYESLCDLGSGAGFPGIVLKIFYPNLNITLVDSLNKRINFLNVVIRELKLKKINTVSNRIEDYSIENEEKYDIVTARAVAPINILLELGIKLLEVNSSFVFLKGNLENEPDYKNAMKKLNCYEKNIIRFKLPYEESNRTLIEIVKKSSTPIVFPRKYSLIKKKPL